MHRLLQSSYSRLELSSGFIPLGLSEIEVRRRSFERQPRIVFDEFRNQVSRFDRLILNDKQFLDDTRRKRRNSYRSGSRFDPACRLEQGRALLPDLGGR